MPTAQIEQITPEQAGMLLEHNTRNRNISRQRVLAMAEKIRNGQFKLTGQAHVIVGSDGVLLNGQHTLSAVIEADHPITTVVARDVDPFAFDAIDTGMKRTAAQVMQMTGHQNAAALAASIRNYLILDGMIRTDSGWTLPNEARINNEDVYAEFFRDTVGWSWAASLAQGRASTARNTGILLAPSPLGTFAFLTQATGTEMDEIEEFVDLVISDVGHVEGQPQTTLRRRLAQQNRNRNSTAKRIDTVASWCKGWNAFVEGRQIERIYPWTRRSATFPYPRLAAPALAQVV